MPRPLSLMLGIALAACTKSQAPAEVVVPPAPSSSTVSSPAPPPAPLATPELRAIIPAAEAADVYFHRPEPKSFFTPVDYEVAAFEAKLPAFLRTHVKSRPGQPALADRAPKYMRQYVGVVEPDGTRHLWGNFFCEYFGHADGGWRHEGFAVKDGGDCYFNLKFDPTQGSFSELMVNGDA